MLLETEILCPGSVVESDDEDKGNGAGEIYTIGCEGYTPQVMADVLRTLDISVLLDCNWKPKRPYRKAANVPGEWAGDRLGNGSISKAHRQEGTKLLLELHTAGKNVMLMYSGETPGNCNRHSVVGKALFAHGVDIAHICGEELVRYSELQASFDEKRDYMYSQWRLYRRIPDGAPTALRAR
jgi:hypothetical protein